MNLSAQTQKYNLLGFSCGYKNNLGIIGMEYSRRIEGCAFINTGIGYQPLNGAQFTGGSHIYLRKEKRINPLLFVNYSITTGEDLVFEGEPYQEYYRTKSGQAIHFGLCINLTTKYFYHYIIIGYKYYTSSVAVINKSPIQPLYEGMESIKNTLKSGMMISYVFLVRW
jgi:hypothetical protein